MAVQAHLSGSRHTGPSRGAEIPLFNEVVTHVGANSTTYTAQVLLPSDCGAVITRVHFHAASVTSDPSLVVGISTTLDAIVAAVNVTATPQSATLASTALGKGAKLTITITNDAGDAFTHARVSVWGYLVQYDGSTRMR